MFPRGKLNFIQKKNETEIAYFFDFKFLKSMAALHDS